MKKDISFVHTNIVAKDWKKLAQFYIDVFGCEPVYPERDLKGDWIDKLTQIKNVHLKGIHLRLPGYVNGPTLEIFEYNICPVDNTKIVINTPGFSHIAFHVYNVHNILDKIIEHGGSTYGELIKKEIEGVGIITAIYTSDPEGNIIEVQNWSEN